MKSKYLIPLVALLSSGFLTAKDGAKTIDPKVTAVLEKSIEALGGRDAMKKIKSRVAKGRMEMPAQKMTMDLDMTIAAPGKVYTKMKMGELMTVEQAYDGKSAWAKDSIQGLRELKGLELAQAKESAALFGELQVLKEMVSGEMLPDEEVNGKKMKVIKITTKVEEPKTLYFDAETNLLAQIKTSAAVGPGGKMEMAMSPSQYKELDGVKVPMLVTLSVGPQKMVMRFTDVHHNKDVDDALFTLK